MPEATKLKTFRNRSLSRKSGKNFIFQVEGCLKYAKFLRIKEEYDFRAGSQF